MASSERQPESQGILWPRSPLAAEFIARKNRFVAEVVLQGTRVLAHVPNSGRLSELLTRGRRVYLLDMAARHRKTSHDLALVEMKESLVSVDARLPKSLFRSGLTNNEVDSFSGWQVLGEEPGFGSGRLDLRLGLGHQEALVETKSVTLVDRGRARFPDAPTTRGVRHLGDLVHARNQGFRAAIVFVVQRDDADSFEPNWSTDPEFGESLEEASRKGVEIYAYGCRVTLRGICLERELPLILKKGV